MSRRTARSATWQNDDGSLTVRQYAAPQFFQPSGSTSWTPIDTTLAKASTAARWNTRANSWSASFGPTGSDGGAEQVTTGTDRIGFDPASPTAAVTPTVAGSTATYRDVWPSTNLVEQVRADSVAESLVLADASAPTSFSFAVSGATVTGSAEGGARLTVDGASAREIPAPTVSLAGHKRAGAMNSGVRLAVSGSSASVSVSSVWLAGLPASAFPVVIDPSYSPPTNSTATSVVSYSSDGRSTTAAAQVGYDASGLWAGAAHIPLPAPPAVQTGQQPWVLQDAVLDGICGTPAPGRCKIDDEEVFGESGQPTSYVGIGRGQLLYEADGQQGIEAVGVTQWIVANPSGSWFGVAGVGYDCPDAEDCADSVVSLPAANLNLSVIYYQEPPPPTVVSPVAGTMIATATPTLTASTPDTAICAFEGQVANSAGVQCDQPAGVKYDFQVSTAPNGEGQTVADSGWIPQYFTLGTTQTSQGYPITVGNTSGVVPAGALVDGGTYYVTVLDADSEQNPYAVPAQEHQIPPAAALPSTMFTVKCRLGAGGPSPTDTIGSAPGQTSTPSAGAPNPGTSPASETVNMVTGDLALAVGTQAMSTLGGPAGVTLTYDSVQATTAHSATSQAGSDSTSAYGLTGRYYLDSGSHVFPASAVGQRVDPDVDVVEATYPPVGAVNGLVPFMVRWIGSITPSAGSNNTPMTWQLGGTAGGMRVYLNGSSTPAYDNWSGATRGLGFGSGTLTGGVTYSVEVDAWVNPSDWLGTVQLWAKNVPSDLSAAVPSVVPSTWLSPQTTGLLAGWSMNGTGGPQWTGLADLGSQVVAHSAAGATEVFARAGSAATFIPQSGSTDSLTEVNGQFQLSSADGDVAQFNSAGQLVTATSAADDLHPTALIYGYAPTSGSPGAPVTLQTITDPVTSRPINLYYGTASGCSHTNGAGLLCAVTSWDGQTTNFTYNSNNELAAIVTSPGGTTTLLGYDSNGRVDDIRDALANDYIAAGQPGSADCAAGSIAELCPFDTTIAYDSTGRVATVTQPTATSGAAPQQRAYAYYPSASDPGAGHTQLRIAGFSPAGKANIPAGVAEVVTYDHNSRVTAQTESTGLTTSTAWDALERPIVTVNAAGEQTSTVYDIDSDITDTYGPAPTACYSASSWPAGLAAPTAPIVGYLPVSNPVGATGCGVAVPHTVNGYDQGITGFGVAYWKNGTRAGAPVSHVTGIPAAVTGCTVTTPIDYNPYYPDSANSVPTGVCGSWAAGSAPVTPDSSGLWSAALTGRLTWTASDQGDQFAICGSQGVSLLIDGQPAGTNITPNNPDYPGGYLDCGTWLVKLTPGAHSIEIDLSGAANQATTYSLIDQPASWGSGPTTWGAWRGVSASQLDPGYGLQTSTTDPDLKKTTASYTASGVDAAYGLQTSTTADPSGLALTTTTSYLNAGVLDPYLRRQSTTLPAGNSTTYQYYTGTAGPLAAVCGVASSTPQGGQVESQIDPPATSGGASREQQFVYDTAGRQVGRRVGPSTSITGTSLQCTTYDSRSRISSESWPAVGNATARTVTYSYSVGGNPLASSVTDTSGGGSVSSVVDLLGRESSYTDATGQTSAITYDQVGRVTSTTGPQGALANAYDPTTSQLSTATRNGTLLATTSYDSADRLNGVTYGDGTTAVMGYDGYGAQNNLAFNTTAGGATITSDQATRSVGGRITSDVFNGSTTDSYGYDGAGRLISATLPNGSATYGYAANPSGDGCTGASGTTSGGLDTNRTRVVFTPISGSATTTDSCYNTADQLIKTIVGSTTSTAYAYDGHGNQTTDNGTALVWDASDRLVKTTTPGGSVTTYAYDPLDRVISRATGATTTHYSYNGFSDTPAATLTSGNVVQQAFVGLPGGVMITVQTSGNTWSYPDLHGNYTATTNNTGGRQSTPDTYDPWGQPTTGQTPLNNATGGSDLGAFGADGKITDNVTNITIMGARPYNSAEARFFSVDPVQGGCANPYTYAFGDPVNGGDLTGLADCEKHHIVPQKLDTPDGLGSTARGILSEADISIDDPANIVLISTVGHRGAGTGLHGSGAQNRVYLQWVVANLNTPAAGGIRGALASMKAQLQAWAPCGGPAPDPSLAPWLVGAAVTRGRSSPGWCSGSDRGPAHRHRSNRSRDARQPSCAGCAGLMRLLFDFVILRWVI